MVTARFGPYELVHRLGTGGMAETYLAVRRGPGGFVQHVCLKRILPAFESDPSFVAQFLEEARLAARLRHGNIAQVVDFGEVGGSHYLALELIDGMDLRTLLQRLRDRGARLSPEQVVHIGLELAAALEVAHRADRERPPIIHRDVSPSNVLVSREGEVYLTDFGIARALGAQRRTDSGVVRGKVPYMAPEYAMTGEFDARTDLFGLGVLLFEALAGERPYQGRTELETLTVIREGRHRSLAELAPGAPPALIGVVEQLLRPEPAARPASAGALLDALASVAPPATVSRQLGGVVRESGQSLRQSLELSGALPTEQLAIASAPRYPDVRPSDPGAATRTAPVSASAGHTAGGVWSATDPTHVSHHDTPSPYAIPATNVSLPAMQVSVIGVDEGTAPERVGTPAWIWALIAGIGLVLFAIAGAGAYWVVQLLQAGP
ncbi:MAG: serine/threonine-protein kinase [Sandaracinaceae bacterium]